MALTVLLVRILNPEGSSDTAAIFIASAYYSEKVKFRRCYKLPLIHQDEVVTPLTSSRTMPECVLQADDSTGTKLAGSVINALIFVVIVGLMTFVLVLLFKYGV